MIVLTIMVFCSALFTSSACSLFFLSSFSINARLRSFARQTASSKRARVTACPYINALYMHSFPRSQLQDILHLFHKVSGHFRTAFKVSRISGISKQLGDSYGLTATPRSGLQCDRRVGIAQFLCEKCAVSTALTVYCFFFVLG